MNALGGKKVLLAGDAPVFARTLTEMLSLNGAAVEVVACASAEDYLALSLDNTDVVVITQLYTDTIHKEFIKRTNQTVSNDFVPILVRMDMETDDIKEVLSLGASDIIDSNASPDVVLNTVLQLFEENSFSNTHTSIDITPLKLTISVADLKVLIVEDDSLLRSLLTDLFKKTHIAFEYNVDGIGVAEQVATFAPNLILLDLMLPGKNGFDVLKEIKSKVTTKDTPVIVFSNRDSQPDRQRAVELGADGFYIKAMTDLSELLLLVQTYSKNKHAKKIN